jgi:hemolysin D
MKLPSKFPWKLSWRFPWKFPWKFSWKFPWGFPSLGRYFDQGPRRNALERAFLPAALEIVETPPSPTWRITGLVIVGFLAGALLWAAVSHMDIIAVAEGKFVPVGQVKVVQPLETAVVTAIHVEEGAHVRHGDTLIELDPTDTTANLGSLRYDRGQALLDAEAARILLADRGIDGFVAPDGANPVLVAAVRDQTREELARFDAAMAAIDAQRQQREAAIRSARAQQDVLAEVIPLLADRYDALKGLFERGNGPKPPMLAVQQELTEKKGNLVSLQQQEEQGRADLVALQATARGTLTQFRAGASDRRLKALQRATELEQQIAKEEMREDRRRLVAPVDGTVQELKTHTVGAVVTTADKLMVVVPDGTPLMIEAYIENRDIGFVREGQPAEVKVDAYPFTRYGTVGAKLDQVGKDAVNENNKGLRFPARLVPASMSIPINGEMRQLMPGMSVAAEIKTGRRTVLDFVLSPVRETLHEAGSER